ncbi:hypothetical protein, partial [Paraburkholderia sp.]|uniref:hypothetical protein n=1 Tax=Paraburkholderia sp. TaxID=1926495 RepID=UPI0025D57431
SNNNIAVITSHSVQTVFFPVSRILRASRAVTDLRGRTDGVASTIESEQLCELSSWAVVWSA